MTLQVAVFLVLPLLISGVGLYLRTFIAEKAKGLASKQDVGAITQEVERIKNGFRVQEEIMKAALAHRTSVQRAQFDLEFATYRELWRQMLALEDTLRTLQSYCLSRDSSSGLIPDAYVTFQRQREALARAAEEVEPFISPDVHRAFLTAMLSMRQVAVAAFTTMSSSREETNQLIAAWVEQVGNGRRALAQALTARLFSESQPTTPVVADDA